MVTSTDAAPPTASMRTIACTLALLAILYVAATAGRLEGRILPFLTASHAEQRPARMSTVTFSKVAGGVTYTRTYLRNEGESEKDFDIRAKALWAEFCALHGI